MGWIEDSIEEFRKLPPAGKIAVGAAAVGVAILAYAHYRSAASGAASGAAGVTGAFPGATGIPSATDGAGGVWTFPSTVQSGTGSGVFLGTLGNGLAPGPGGVHAPPVTNDGGLRTLLPVTPAVPSFVQTAAAHVASSASGPPPPPALQAAPMPSSARPIISFIPTTIRPRPTPGRGRAQ